MKKYFLFCAVFALVLVGAGCSRVDDGEDTRMNDDPSSMKEETGPIKLGFIGPLTADAAELGNDARIATEIAVEEINEAGGINGRELQVIYEDGKCNPKDGTSAAVKLSEVDQVPVIIGALCSGETTGAAPVAERNETVLFSYCSMSSAPPISEAGDYIFRSYPSDAFQGKFAAEYIYNEMGKRKVAVLAGLTDWGIGIRDAFVNRFEELGGEIVLSANFTQGNKDFRTELTKVKNSEAELLYFAAFTDSAVAGLKQIREVGLEMEVFGGDAWSDPDVQNAEGGEGIMFTLPSITTDSDELKAKIEEKGGNTTVCVPRAYDNTKLIAEIMTEVGTNSRKIKDALYKVKDYEGVGGLLTMDEKGDPTIAMYRVMQIVNGEEKELFKQ